MIRRLSEHSMWCPLNEIRHNIESTGKTNISMNLIFNLDVSDMLKENGFRRIKALRDVMSLAPWKLLQ